MKRENENEVEKADKKLKLNNKTLAIMKSILSQPYIIRIPWTQRNKSLQQSTSIQRALFPPARQQEMKAGTWIKLFTIYCPEKPDVTLD